MLFIITWLPSQHQEYLNQKSLEDAWTCWLAMDGVCKAEHKAYNLYTVWSWRARELLLYREVWRIYPLIIVIG